MRLTGKRAVITGGASGIGAATSRRFAAEGAHVAILDYDLARAQTIADQIHTNGGEAIALRCDVTEENSVQASATEAAHHLGAIDILFNSAGIAIRRPVTDTDIKDWDRVMDTNLRGSYLASKFCLQHFPPQGGAIIHVSSVTGLTGVRGRAAYSATKGALIALTRNMAIDLAPRNIRVNCVCPGFVRTPLVQAIFDEPERHARLLNLHPLGRLGEPEDVASAVLFLASDEAQWITGISVPIDGGFSCGRSEDI